MPPVDAAERRRSRRRSVTISIYSRFCNSPTDVGAAGDALRCTLRIGQRMTSRATDSRRHSTIIRQYPSFELMLPDHEIEIRVRYYETDAQGFVHHANYFQYFELARVEQLLALGYDYAHLERDGIILVVNKIACKYHRPCKFGDTLRLQIRTVRARAARIDHEYRLLRGNELLAEAESTLACIDRQGRVQRLPEFLMMIDKTTQFSSWRWQ